MYQRWTRIGKLAGKLVLIDKTLYGLQLLGRMYEELLADYLLELGFERLHAERNIWMQRSPKYECYEYVATYIDDLCIIMKDPEEFLAQLESDRYNFELKGLGEITFHLGCSFVQDSTGTLCMDP